MASLQVLSNSDSPTHSQGSSTQRVPEHNKLTFQEQRPVLNVPKKSQRAYKCLGELKIVSNHTVTPVIESQKSIPDTSAHKNLQSTHSYSSNSLESSKGQSGTKRIRPTSSRPVSNRTHLAAGSAVTFYRLPNQPGTGSPRTKDFDSSLPYPVYPGQHNDNLQSKPGLSRLSFYSSPEEREVENVSPALDGNLRAASCDPLLSRRSISQSKYHERCFPKENPALIIGSPYRIHSARERRTKSAHKRPTIKYREPLFTNREAVVNIVYTAQSDGEQDELSRARAETERDARALRSSGLSSGSFSRGFFNQTNRWAYPAQKRKWVQHHHSNQHFNMAGTLGSQCEYPTLQEDDCSVSRYTYSRQSCSPHSDSSTPVPGQQMFRPNSERSLFSTGRQTDSPQSESDQPQSRTSSFLYQMVAFDNLADNVPPFVRQNVKKNGRMQTESFILRLNYLRRRRALGETSSTINNNAKAKAASTAAAAPNSTGGGGTATIAGQGEFSALS